MEIRREVERERARDRGEEGDRGREKVERVWGGGRERGRERKRRG